MSSIDQRAMRLYGTAAVVFGVSVIFALIAYHANILAKLTMFNLM